MIRKATLADTRDIHQLLLGFAKNGLVLSRSLAEIYEGIRDFHVDEVDGQVVGVVALSLYWEDLAEVRSLAVRSDFGGRGIGRALVEACVAEARALGLKRLFALTYQPEFFGRLGFEPVEKADLPQKIWRDCMKCAKFPDCDELAFIFQL
mgnify:CR=1 FL=1